MKNNIEEKIIKTDKGYFFDTDTEYYLKLSDEITDVIEAPSSDFQDEGERWQTVEDLIDDMLRKMPTLLTPDVDEKNVKPEDITNDIQVNIPIRPVSKPFEKECITDHLTIYDGDIEVAKIPFEFAFKNGVAVEITGKDEHGYGTVKGDGNTVKETYKPDVDVEGNLEQIKKEFGNKFLLYKDYDKDNRRYFEEWNNSGLNTQLVWEWITKNLKPTSKRDVIMGFWNEIATKFTCPQDKIMILEVLENYLNSDGGLE